MKTLLELRSVSKAFVRRRDPALQFVDRVTRREHQDQVTYAVQDVSVQIRAGEVVGLVGESGCGKSTLGRVIAGIHSPTSGAMVWRGELTDGMTRQRRNATNLAIQMIFQDPLASLNPRMRVREIIGEAPVVHKLVRPKDLDGYVDTMLQRVGLDPSYKVRYPHQFSGGQRQRIGIARALAVQPEFLICDESVAALDVSIQAQVINLFMELRQELGLTYLFISHDLGLVEHIADRILIMYLGRIVEVAPTEEMFSAPNHPYTKGLLAEIPRIATRPRDFSPIKGEIPSPLHPPSGCHFHPRCPLAIDRCKGEYPGLRQVATGHWSACHLNAM